MKKRTADIFVIVDKVSGLCVSGLIPCLNEGVAMNGFRNYLEEEEKKGLNKAMYELYRVGIFNDDGSIDTLPESREFICNGESCEESFEEWCEIALARERAEEA